MSAEQAARQNIDKLLQEAGWHVCDVANADIHASRGVAIREFPLTAGFGFADYLLYVDGKAAGVVEAKKEGTTTGRSAGFEWRALRLNSVVRLAAGVVVTVLDKKSFDGSSLLLASLMGPDIRQPHVET